MSDVVNQLMPTTADGWDFSVASLQGYHTHTDPYNNWQIQQPVPKGTPTTTTTAVTKTVATYIPGQTAIIGRPAIPATPTVVDYLLKRGWDTTARSIEPLSHENYIEFSVNQGTGGAFLGLGPQGFDDHSTGSFPHAMVVDDYGIAVMENGVKVHTLKSTHKGTARLRITVQPYRIVVYMVVTDTDVQVYVSETKAQNVWLYGYGRIYTSGDVIVDAVIAEGQVQFGRA